MPLTKTYSIPHIIQGTSGAAQVILKPSAIGSGVIAGGSVRTVLELAGIKNILTKQLRSSSIINNARATLNALTNLTTFKKISEERDISLYSLYEQQKTNNA